MSVVKIKIESLYKIFGTNPQMGLEHVKNGVGKDELLSKYSHVLGLQDINLNVQEKSIQVIMGLSGSGKSTLIRHINRLIEPTAGKITVEDQDVMAYNKNALRNFRRQKTAMVFQRFGLFPHKTVIENVGYGLEVQGKKPEERNKTSMEKIEAVGLIGFEHQYPNQLSGGMQQRVGLARALATNTDIMLMDEAFSALDPIIRSDMQKQLIDLQAELKKTILFISHDLDESLKLGDHIGILNHGRLVQTGSPIDIIMNPADDYVAAFVKDVNRAKVIKAKIIMITPEKFKSQKEKNSNTIKVNEDSFLDEFLPQVCLTPATVEVVDKSGKVKGYITEKELSEALTKSKADILTKSKT